MLFNFDLTLITGSSGAAKFSEGESSDAHLDSTTMRNTGSSSGLNKSTHSDKSENDDYVIVSLVSIHANVEERVLMFVQPTKQKQSAYVLKINVLSNSSSENRVSWVTGGGGGGC